MSGNLELQPEAQDDATPRTLGPGSLVSLGLGGVVGAGVFVSIGIDCDVAKFLKRHNVRNMAFPFDWNVSYNGVSKCFENNFANFSFQSNKINKYDVYFHHDFQNDTTINTDVEKYNRRCERLINILETTNDTILFIKKGHISRHHIEPYGQDKIANDIEDVEHLNNILRHKYPQLKYKIVLGLGCDICFSKDTIYKSNNDGNDDNDDKNVNSDNIDIRGIDEYGSFFEYISSTYITNINI